MIRHLIQKHHRDQPMAQTLRLAFALTAIVWAISMIFTASSQAATDKPLRIVAFGDSLTAGYNLPSEQAFPVVLEAALRKKGHNVSVTNAGVSGDTTTGGLARLDWSVPDGTDAVILELGANDMLRGVDPAISAKALDTMIARLKTRNIPVLLAGMRAAPNLGQDYAERFEKIYTDLGQKYGLMIYPFFMEGVLGDNALIMPDGLHPNQAGVRKMVEQILPTVEQFIATLPAPG